MSLVDPQSNVESYLANLNGESTPLPLPPESNVEKYLAKMAGVQDVELPHKPESRVEVYLEQLALNPPSPGEVTVRPLAVTQNGTYSEEGIAYSPVNVNVQPNLITKAITANGTYRASEDSADGYSEVDVAIPDPVLDDITITENGVYTSEHDGFDEVTVSVQPPANSYQLKSIATPTSLATFEASAMPMPTLKVSVEAKQDLHGYDKPWVGGAGKNKLPMTVDGIKALNTSGTWSGNSYTVNGVTFTIQTDADGNVVGIKVNGIATADIVFMCGYYILKAGSSIKYSGSVNGSISTFWVAYHGYPKAPNGDGTADRTSASTDWNGNLEIGISNGTSLSNQMFYPMIRLATESDSTFVPYSNSCPISGWDNAIVSDVGKNLLDGTFLQGYWRGTDGGFQPNSLWVATNKIPCLGNVDYVISANSYTTRWQAFLWYDADGNYISQSGIDVTALIGFSAKSPINARYLAVDIAGTTQQTEISPSDVTNFQIELGSTATEYVPYVEPNLYTISLGQTVYYGEIDVINGVLTVKWIKPDLSQLSYLKSPSGLFYTESIVGTIKKPLATATPTGFIKSSIFNEIDSNSISGPTGTTPSPNGVMALNASGRLYFNYTDTTDIDTFKSDMANVDFIYELATPIIINLTPSLIKSLNGINNLSVDCGDVIEGEYFKAL